MKITSLSFLLFVFFAIGCAHSPAPLSYPAPAAVPLKIEQQPPAPADNSVLPRQESVGEAALPAQQQETAETAAPVNAGGDFAGNSGSAAAELAGDYQESEELSKPDHRDIDNSGKSGTAGNGKRLTIADPLEPFNRAMFQFNDKLYFWVLKPVARAYKNVVHEDVRAVVKNFFSNAAFPVRFVNCLLQANLTGALSEVGRFALNTLVGFGGLFDPASDKEINLARHGEDFGQTLGLYGIGHGFYIHWPLFGPSSPRDTIGMAGDSFLNPFSYLDQWYETAGVSAYDRINETSFSIGDYEALKQAAIDPYVSVRDAYVQYRFNKVKRRDGFYAPTNDGAPER
ncbi:MAG: MlaA family lipoprotein [Syntrophales bacterium]